MAADCVRDADAQQDMASQKMKRCSINEAFDTESGVFTPL